MPNTDTDAPVMAPIHPGEMLLEDFLEPLGVSQYRLAQAIGVAVRRINEIVHGTRRISADTALRLSRFFGMRWILDEPSGSLRPRGGKGPALLDAPGHHALGSHRLIQ
jgi:addiction module HigA family antidote